MDYVDAEAIELKDDAVIVAKDGQRISDSRLEVFQKSGTLKVGCQFICNEGGYVGFSLDEYDESMVLVIDPVCLAYSTFLGGRYDDFGYGIAAENGYVTGCTYSPGFPTRNAYDETFDGADDCFVTKLAQDGQSLVYSTFLGGGFLMKHMLLT